LPQNKRTQNKVVCPDCHRIGSIYEKKAGIHIPQKSQIKDLNTLLDFCSIKWYREYEQNMEVLRGYSSIPLYQPIFDNSTRYQYKVPFSIHSHSEITQFEKEIFSKIINEVNECSGTGIDQDKNTRYTQDNILRDTILSAYSYISFTSLKKFNQYLEPIPITISDKDLKEIVHEFGKSVQYMTHDARRVYPALELAKSVIMNRNETDFYYKLQPVYKGKEARCTDCRRTITLDEQAGDDLNRYRCPHCYHRGGSILAGKLTRKKPSAKHQRQVIHEQLRTLNRYSQNVNNIFELIRDKFIANDESTKLKFKSTFDECFSDFLEDIGPPDFKLAVKHYVPSERNNKPCYIKTEDALMDLRILDFEYLNALAEIYLKTIEGPEVPAGFISVAERKLMYLKFPQITITKKMAKDLDWIDNLVTNGLQNTINELKTAIRNGMPFKNLKNVLTSEMKDHDGKKNTLFLIMLINSFIQT